jgi:hypothetical protein
MVVLGLCGWELVKRPWARQMGGWWCRAAFDSREAAWDGCSFFIGVGAGGRYRDRSR